MSGAAESRRIANSSCDGIREKPTSPRTELSSTRRHRSSRSSTRFFVAARQLPDHRIAAVRLSHIACLAVDAACTLDYRPIRSSLSVLPIGGFSELGDGVDGYQQAAGQPDVGRGRSCGWWV